MEIARHATGHRPNFLCTTAGIAIRGTCSADKALIGYANAGKAFVVLYLAAQSAA